jgi:hypothetical protein
MSHSRTVRSSLAETANCPSDVTATRYTWPVCPAKRCIGLLLLKSHWTSSPSSEPEMREFPSGSMAKHTTGSRCLPKAPTSPPFSASQMLKEETFPGPPLAEYSLLPSLDSTRSRHQSRCRPTTRISFPARKSQRRIVPSSPLEYRWWPSGATRRACTEPRCPSRRVSSTAVSIAHTRIVPSAPPVTRRRPSSSNATLVAPPGCARNRRSSPTWGCGLLGLVWVAFSQLAAQASSGCKGNAEPQAVETGRGPETAVAAAATEV